MMTLFVNDPTPGISEGPDGPETVCCPHSRGNIKNWPQSCQSKSQVYHLNLTFPLEDYDEHYQACPGGWALQ